MRSLLSLSAEEVGVVPMAAVSLLSSSPGGVGAVPVGVMPLGVGPIGAVVSE